MLLVIWDIDGTLVEGAGAGHRALVRAVSTVLETDVDLDGMDYAGRTDRSLFEEALARGGGRPATDWMRVRDQYIRILQQELASGGGRALPGAEDALMRLGAMSDVRQVIGTGNIEAGAWIKLGYFGLAKYFGTGGFGDNHRVRTPVIRDAFLAAQRHYEAQFDPVVVVGDTPRDADAAKALNIHAVGVATGRYSHGELEPHFAVVLDSLAPTETFLSALLDAPPARA